MNLKTRREVISDQSRTEISKRIFASIEEIFSDPETKVFFEYTQFTYRTLLYIDSHEPCHPSDIAEALNSPRPNVAQVLASLQRKRYVRRRRDRRDMRKVYVSLTDTGREALDRKARDFAALMDRLERHLGDRATDFSEMLEIIATKSREEKEG